jgi:hypothetical protein
MNNTLLHIQVFYELAAAIGNSPYLEPMMRDALSAYLHKLGCSAGLAARLITDSSGDTRIQPVTAIPRKEHGSAALEKAIGEIPSVMNAEERHAFMQTLPKVFEVDNGKRSYLMEVPNFGLLLLIKSGEPFEESVLKSLTRLNIKLSQACSICLHTEEVARINKLLNKEIEERLHAEAELQKLSNELESRVEERTIELVHANKKLEEALGNVKTLSGLIPICSVCKKIRDDQGYWKQIETYISSHSDAMFTHGICPGCAEKVYKEHGLFLDES